jgi:hypothetical protein
LELALLPSRAWERALLVWVQALVLPQQALAQA